MTKETFNAIAKNAFLECEISLVGKDTAFNYGSVRARTKYGEVYEIGAVVRSAEDSAETKSRRFYEINKGAYGTIGAETGEDFINITGPRNMAGAFVMIGEIIEINWEVCKVQRRI